MNFEGEHLLPGQLGHFFVILAFIASLVAAVSYFNASRDKDLLSAKNWLTLAKGAFFVQTFSVIFVFSVIFYICFNHYYEYMYAYKHASMELEYKYLLACIWEGQEGSFLLWAICQSLLGLVLIFKSREWQAPVMSVISLAQLFLLMMILGIYIFDVRIGNSPFTLTRNEISAPIFSQPNYLSFIKDGMGLNVLLRNYWMVIHPPVLFLGFASTLIPFAYAYAGIQTKRYGEWVKPVLPWALFGAAILGAGIMMGGKWAYESLSFGGYWAWDPVENASLVPWLILIAGLHTMVIYNATGHSLRASYLLGFLPFIFVLYSTFLTRTGVLGDTSVHAFTEAGKAINIMIGTFVLVFTVPMLFLFLRNYKKIPAITREEQTSSREFWMFIGSIVFFLSALFIIAITSIPLYNKIPVIKDLIIKLHNGPLAMPENAEFLYNKVMVLVAVIIGLLTATAQYLKYKSTGTAYFLKKIALPTITAAVVTTLVILFFPLTFYKHGTGYLVAIYLAFFAVTYAAIANAMYIFSGMKGKLKLAGASVAHAGFALMIAGILISSSNKVVISSSMVNGINLPASIDPMTKQQDDPRENLTLLRDVPTTMGKYEVTYLKDSAGHEKGRKYYELLFRQTDPATKKIKEQFTLKPDVYLMKDNNMSSNPDTKSYLTKDIFTYVSFVLNENQPSNDTASFKISEMHEGDTAYYSNGYFILNSIVKNPVNEKYKFTENDVALMANITVVNKDNRRFTVMPLLHVDEFGIVHADDTLYAQNMFFRFAGVSDNHHVKIGVKESDSMIDFVTVKSYIYPYVNLVWLGLVIMAAGLIMSMVQRGKFNTVQAAIALIIAISGLSYLFLLAN